MKIHPRETLIDEAERIIRQAYLDVDQLRLTATELIYVVQNASTQRINSYLKFALRKERHGTTDKPSGEA